VRCLIKGSVFGRTSVSTKNHFLGDSDFADSLSEYETMKAVAWFMAVMGVFAVQVTVVLLLTLATIGVAQSELTIPVAISAVPLMDVSSSSGAAEMHTVVATMDSSTPVGSLGDTPVPLPNSPQQNFDQVMIELVAAAAPNASTATTTAAPTVTNISASVVNSSALLPNGKLGTTSSIPEIFIIGAAKCGTTSLHELLVNHPDICDSGIKEKHFFDEPVKIFRQQHNNLEAYQKLFLVGGKSKNPANRNCKYHVDSTPAYIRSPNAIINMNGTFTREQMSAKKFILVLREPTARECSWYQHFARGCLEHLEAAMKRIPPNGDKGGWKRSICHHSTHGHYCEKLSCVDHNEGDITKVRFYLP
jgi:hypothetical protein